MPDLFKYRSGAVNAWRTEGAAFIEVDGFQLGTGSAFLATSFGIDRGQVVQHLKVFSNEIFSYAFGEAPGKVTVGGYIFLRNCSASQAVAAVNSFYEKNNIYSREGACQVIIGGAHFKCYLENFSARGDNNPFNLASFNLVFTTIPSKK